MNLSFRIGAAVAALAALVAAGCIYIASDHIAQGGKAAGEAREATLHAYRIAQSLKSLSNGYELAMNEYYSTVLEAPAYQKKAADHRNAIERELSALSKLQVGEMAAIANLNQAFKEMGTYRLTLEAAMSAPEKNWDGAREALYKVNVVSVRGIYQADTLAQAADERAVMLDRDWQDHESQAETMMRIAMLLAVLAGALASVSAFLARTDAEKPTPA